MTVGKQRHVIVTIPDDTAEGPGTRQAAKVWSRFEKRDLVASRGEAVGQGQAEHPASNNPPMAVRAHRNAVYVPEAPMTNGGASSTT